MAMARGGDYDEDDEETEEIELDSRKEDSGRPRTWTRTGAARVSQATGRSSSGPAPIDWPCADYHQVRSVPEGEGEGCRGGPAIPDEIDTPRHIAARPVPAIPRVEELQDESWDPYENLRSSTAAFSSCEDFARTGKRLLKDAKEAESRWVLRVPLHTKTGVTSGSRDRVTIVLKDVPKSVVEDRDAGCHLSCTVCCSIEHKQSVLHFLVQRNTEYEEPVKAKVST